MNWVLRSMLFVAATGLVVAAQPPQFGRTLAGITVGQDDVDKVRLLYGRGAETEADHIKTVCYYFEQDRAYLTVSTFENQNRVRSVMLTTLTAVMPGCQGAKVTGKRLIGPGGIRLGDSLQTVVAALGSPSRTGKMPTGSQELVFADYDVSGGHGTCQFARDKLVLTGLELD